MYHEVIGYQPNMTRAQIEERIDARIVGYHNCGRDRDILRRRLLDGVTFERLAEEFALSTRQTKRIVYRAEQIIFRNKMTP